MVADISGFFFYTLPPFLYIPGISARDPAYGDLNGGQNWLCILF